VIDSGRKNKKDISKFIRRQIEKNLNISAQISK
jgi:hypothetical protein